MDLSSAVPDDGKRPQAGKVEDILKRSTPLELCKRTEGGRANDAHSQDIVLSVVPKDFNH